MSTNQEEGSILWKEEPLSPNGTSSPSDTGEDWLLFDEKPVVLGACGEEFTFYDEQLTRVQVVTKFLEELDSPNWIKEESFADWLEEKIDLPIFEDLPAPECGQNHATAFPPLNKPQPIIVPNATQNIIAVGQLQPTTPQLQQHHQQQLIVDETQSLLREFETVLGDVEACYQTGVVSTLTPPQSPPPKVQQQLLVTLQPLYQNQPAAFFYDQTQNQQHIQNSIAVAVATRQQPVQQHHETEAQYSIQSLPLASSNEQTFVQPAQTANQWSAENLSLVPLGSQSDNDVVQELAKVDEYIRNCAEDACGASNSASSIASSAPASPCTSSNASCISSEDSSDPDWSYESVPTTSRGRPARTARRATNKPYSRPNVEDKRSRKKEQNKNAATRYRQKKKEEIKIILSEEQELAEKNEKLHGQVKDLQREIGYLKNLMRDLFKVKGLIK